MRTHDRPIRVVLGKPGLDGHDRGAKVVARTLRDAGMEVIYTGLHQTPQEIARIAIQEDADVIGLSVLSGAHLALVDQLIEALRAEDAAEDFTLLVGGIIPTHDIPRLKAAGVDHVYPPGSSLSEIISFLRGRFAREQ